MKRLQLLRLGFYEQGKHETAPRDKFQLDAGFVGVLAVRDTDGFIRADRFSLLFRAVTDRLRASFPPPLLSRSLERDDGGIQWGWGKFQSETEVGALFEAVLQTAGRQTRGDLPPDAAEPTADLDELDSRVQTLLRVGVDSVPEGDATPPRVVRTVEVIKRDPRVKAWVLQYAAGRCELCFEPGPFETYAGLPYLEVHHVTPVADGGADTVNNAVAVCPNCHRRLHLSADAAEALRRLRAQVSRLEASNRASVVARAD